MAETFSILRQKNSLNTSLGQLEYLRTHPLDNNRIAEATDRATALPRTPRSTAIDFPIFRARISILGSEDVGHLKRLYRSQYLKKPNVENSYALALIHQLANQEAQAKEYLASLDKLTAAHPMVELLRADIENLSHASTNTDLLNTLSDLYPNRYSIIEKRLDQLIRERQLTEASVIVRRYLADSRSPNPLAWRQLAGIQQRLDDKAGSHESLAHYFESLDELGRAAGQLELALKEVSPGSQDKLRLDASLRDLYDKANRSR